MDSKTYSAAVPASEFVRNFGRYRVQAQRGAVPVTSHGEITGYFIAPHEYEEYESACGPRGEASPRQS